MQFRNFTFFFNKFIEPALKLRKIIQQSPPYPQRIWSKSPQQIPINIDVANTVIAAAYLKGNTRPAQGTGYSGVPLKLRAPSCCNLMSLGLNSLATLSMENDLVKKITVESALKTFADLKARKKYFGRIMNIFFSLYQLVYCNKYIILHFQFFL